jgi:hypothetical protein
MNLREGCGRVPIKSEGETPWTLVEFPTREDFDAMFLSAVSRAARQILDHA